MDKLDPDKLVWKAGINEYVLRPGGAGGSTTAPFRWPALGCYARVISITAYVDSETGIQLVRWSVLSRDTSVLCVVAAAQTLLPAVAPGTAASTQQCVFLVNQQPLSPVQDANNVESFAPGFLPPDLWLNPSDHVQLDLIQMTDPAAFGIIQQAILRFFVPPQ